MVVYARYVLPRFAKGWILPALQRNIGPFTTVAEPPSRLSDMPTLSAKHLECCSEKLLLLDGKDTLRIWKGVVTFYRNYEYILRAPDAGFIQSLISHSTDVTNGYTCDELSQLSEHVCNMVSVNDVLLPFATPLYSKIGVMFHMRLAESTPYDVVRLLVSFSRIGVKDVVLLESLAEYICMSDGFSEYDLRNILTSYAMVGYQSPALFKYVTERFLSAQGVSINDVAILSFGYTSVNYITPEVRTLFEKHIFLDGKGHPSLMDLKDCAVDIPLFCLNLDRMGLKIPNELIELIRIDDLTESCFLKLAHLLPITEKTQRKVL
uniref:Uncharacterized protein n=1 Tax=Babesia bovis TaxID=5865 RepID=A7AW95_BABBO|eukprot:XP_001608891.1 hypothetical protein [Babesia bovis T2Bo]